MGKTVDDANIGGSNIGATTAAGTIAGHVVTVRTLNIAGTTLNTTVGTADINVQFGSGEMVIDSANDIWIYTNAISG